MGKKATHTAGPCPLKVTGPHLSGKFVIVTAHGNHYATTYDPAAARLIAAAPDLLDAAKNARDVLAALVTGDSPTLAELRAAIDKATGGDEPYRLPLRRAQEQRRRTLPRELRRVV
jgi:hypothetical protein